MKPTKEKTMEVIYLQSSLQFGETLKSVSDSDYRILRDNYDALLKQPLKLEMFVPCDENGNVLEEPKRWNDYLQFPDSFDGNKEWGDLYNYELAIERVLFKGFKHYLFRQANNIQHNKSRKCFSFPNYNGVIIEDLISLEVELTESAIKQIEL